MRSLITSEKEQKKRTWLWLSSADGNQWGESPCNYRDPNRMLFKGDKMSNLLEFLAIMFLMAVIFMPLYIMRHKMEREQQWSKINAPDRL